jgi:hypothetical protein
MRLSLFIFLLRLITCMIHLPGRGKIVFTLKPEKAKLADWSKKLQIHQRNYLIDLQNVEINCNCHCYRDLGRRPLPQRL